MKESLSPWKSLARRSQNLRKSIETLLHEAEDQLEKSDERVIAGSRLVEIELREWQKRSVDWISQAKRIDDALRTQKGQKVESFDAKIQRALAKEGYQVFGETGLFVVNGILHIETDAHGGSVKGNGIEWEPEITSILQNVETELARIERLITSPQQMLVNLLEAYEREIRLNGRQIGMQADVTALLMHLTFARQKQKFRSEPTSSNFSEYPRHIFRADLNRLLSAGAFQTGKKILKYASGSETAGSVFLYIPALGRTGHIGRMWFELVEEERA